MTARENGHFPIAEFTPGTQSGLPSGFGRRAVKNSVCPRGGAVILSGEKPQPASYSIYKPAVASRSRPYTERPSVADRAGKIPGTPRRRKLITKTQQTQSGLSNQLQIKP
ncbi:MAG: hypothetical protein LBH43_00275 [Treponema sp.]|nr:hypothetical protein [Treponema sp.]